MSVVSLCISLPTLANYSPAGFCASDDFTKGSLAELSWANAIYSILGEVHACEQTPLSEFLVFGTGNCSLSGTVAMLDSCSIGADGSLYNVCPGLMAFLAHLTITLELSEIPQICGLCA